MPGGWYEALKERRVFRAVIGYGIVSFGVLQVVEPIMHGLGLPEWVLTATVVALGVGFPVTVVLAWIFDVNAGRIEITQPRAPMKRLALLAAIGAALAAPGVGWYFWKHQRAPGPPSIAVLAFADLSPGKDQEYFSDGIAEEILDALARVKGLHVAGRTSSFHFKGRNEDLRTIGQTLGVANVLEGSVRKQGNKVRITAQLIQASDGFHRWSKTFDGELTDVFALQESIARAITGELKIVLQGEERLAPVVTSDPEAHALYLQSSAALNQRDFPRMGLAIGWLGKALQLDPQFARGHARLALMHAIGRPEFGASVVEAERHARLASELDPSLAEPWMVLGIIAVKQRRWVEARSAFERALALEPDNPSAHFYFAQELIITGYTRLGTEQLERTLDIDPILPNALAWRGRQHELAGEIDAGERDFARAAEGGLSTASVGFAEAASARGDFARARALITPRVVESGGWTCFSNPAASVPVLMTGIYGGTAGEQAKALALIDECLATKPSPLPLPITVYLLRLGQPARALAILRQGPSTEDPAFFPFVWSKEGLPARRLPEFAALLREAGFVEVWERAGAPDACRRSAPGVYSCD